MICHWRLLSKNIISILLIFLEILEEGPVICHMSHFYWEDEPTPITSRGWIALVISDWYVLHWVICLCGGYKYDLSCTGENGFCILVELRSNLALKAYSGKIWLFNIPAAQFYFYFGGILHIYYHSGILNFLSCSKYCISCVVSPHTLWSHLFCLRNLCISLLDKIF